VGILPCIVRAWEAWELSFLFGPRGAGIRRLTGRQKIQGNQYQYQKERLIRHTGQSGHGSGDSGPKWLAHPRELPFWKRGCRESRNFATYRVEIYTLKIIFCLMSHVLMLIN